MFVKSLVTLYQRFKSPATPVTQLQSSCIICDLRSLWFGWSFCFLNGSRRSYLCRNRVLFIWIWLFPQPDADGLRPSEQSSDNKNSYNLNSVQTFRLKRALLSRWSFYYMNNVLRDAVRQQTPNGRRRRTVPSLRQGRPYDLYKVQIIRDIKKDEP
jgi:hypothetical protein